MSWPIQLTHGQSDAVESCLDQFVQTQQGEARACLAILLSQIRRGLVLLPEEVEVLRGIMLLRMQESSSPELETAYYRLFHHWGVEPWWKVILANKYRRG